MPEAPMKTRAAPSRAVGGRRRRRVRRTGGAGGRGCRPAEFLIGQHRKTRCLLSGGANSSRHPGDRGGEQEGHINLTELITKKYGLDEIIEGYQNLMDGKNIRGVIVNRIDRRMQMDQKERSEQ
jgi:hypothetical protein